MLEKGYRVRAQVRNPEKMPLHHSNLSLHKGDVLDANFVAELIEGTQAVISTIGHVKGSDPRVQSKGTAHMIAGMQAHAVKRIISLTGAGIPAEGDKPGLGDRFMRLMMNTFFKDVIRDGKEHAELLRRSSLDYTIVRGPRLTEKPAKGSLKVGLVGDIGMDMTREDLAHFMVKILEDKAYFRKEPAVSN